MKEAVRDLGHTLEEAASETGVVSGLIDSIGKALAEVRSYFRIICNYAVTLCDEPQNRLRWAADMHPKGDL